MSNRFLSRSARRVSTPRHAVLALLLVGLSVTSNSVHAQLTPTAVYESGAEGEIWRFIGSVGASYKSACYAAGYDPNVDCWDYVTAAPDELWEPIGFDIDDAGSIDDYRVLVADRFNSRIVVFDYFGNHLQTVDEFVGANGVNDALAGPEAVVLDAAGNIVVSDTYNQRLVVFDNSFAYRFEVPMSPGVEPASLALRPGAALSAPDGCAKRGPVALALTTWGYPDGTPVSDKNLVLLYDSHMCRVGELGIANATSNQPPGSWFLAGSPAFGANGEIYVAGYQENKVEVFIPDASAPSGYVRGLGLNTGEPNTTVTDHNGLIVNLAGPYGLIVDKRNRLIVSDANNNRVAVFLQPWHPDNTSPRDPANPAVGTRWQFAFELVAQGQLTGAYLAMVREDRFGRWLTSSVVNDVVYAFELPELAVVQASAAEVDATAGGDVIRVRGNVVVPVGKSELTTVIPTIEHDASNPSSNRASLGPPLGPFLAAPGADVFDPAFAGTPITAIDRIQPGHYAQVYWDYPVQSDGQAQFLVSARKIAGLAGDIVADAKTTLAETIPGSCAAPTLNVPVFGSPKFQTTDRSTGAAADVYGEPLTLTLSASQPDAGVREIRYQFLEGPLNGQTGTLPGASGAVTMTLGYDDSLFWTIRYRAVSNCGALSPWETARFKIDVEAPRLFFGPVSPAHTGIDPDGRTWHSAPAVTMRVVASDDDTFSSNVVFPDYPSVVDGTLDVSFTDEGAGQSRFIRVQDPVGNEFSEFTNRLAFVHIDRSAPQLTMAPLLAPNTAGWYRTDVPFRVVAEDAPQLSGVKSLTASSGLTITSSSRHRVEAQALVSGEGAVTISPTAQDFAGNVRTASAQIKIDKTAPHVAVSPAPAGLHSQPLAVHLVASDLPGGPNALASGVALVRYSLNGGPSQAYTTPIVLNTLGLNTLTVWAEDAAGNSSAPRTTSYTIVANRAPTCVGAVAQPGLIWPVNHREVAVTIQGVADPDGDDLSIVVTRILQDEPTNTVGDGNTSSDAGGIGTAAPWVRAERMGPQADRNYNNGRIYEIAFTAVDNRGGSCDGRVTVGVPHDQGHGSSVIDNGCRWDSVNGGPMLSCLPGGRPPAGTRD